MPQVAEFSDTKLVEYYNSVWKTVLQESSSPQISFTPEYGPKEDGYLPQSRLENGNLVLNDHEFLNDMIISERLRFIELLQI